MAKEQTRTPGPWRRFGGLVDGYGIAGENGTIIIAQKPFNGLEHDANAHLIAAAPDMLGALQKALEELEYIDTHCGVRNEHGNWIEIDQKAIQRVRAAIAKAKGEA